MLVLVHHRAKVGEHGLAGVIGLSDRPVFRPQAEGQDPPSTGDGRRDEWVAEPERHSQLLDDPAGGRLVPVMLRQHHGSSPNKARSRRSVAPCLLASDAPRCNDRDVPVSMRCPRCKYPLEAADPDALADALLAHLRDAHGHEPPREHVLARIERQNQGGDTR
jgi:hypothetical protein